MAVEIPLHLDIVNSEMVRVCCVASVHHGGLERLAFAPMAYGEGRLWFRDNPGDDEGMAALLSGLRDMGCAFSKVHQTAQLFARLRQAGLISGGYQEIDWSEPGNWFVTER
jgi:hypothetical protein